MAKKAPSRRQNSPKAQPHAPAGEPFATLRFGKLVEWIPLTGLLTMSVATCLVPSETPPAIGWEIPLVMGWMMLLGAWAVIGMFRKHLVLRYDLASVALLVFFFWLCLSSAINLSDSHPRATLNMTFRWLSFAIMFFAARHILVTPRLQRAAVAAMISLAIGIASLGIYEYAVTKPAQRKAFEANPEAAMREAGVYTPKDSPAGRQFADRVASVEPLGTFALTNSLAGFLTPWLVVGCGILWHASRKQLTSFRKGETPSANDLLPMLALTGLIIVAFCLLLTKSRSAWGATAAGMLLVALGTVASGLKLDWKWLLGGLALVAIMIGVAIVAGGLDTEVASEAIKSLSFRMQYWRATAAMIVDHPWFGIGVGNFQDHYAAYKLPNASEMISDPHNFVLEVISTIGIPGIVPLVIMLIGISWYTVRAIKAMPDETPPTESKSQAPKSLLPVYFGVAMGFIMAVPLQLMSTGPDLSTLLIVAPVTGCCLLAFSNWIEQGELPIVPLFAGLFALLVNLLAAGGIGFASVSINIWLLAALILGMASYSGGWHGQLSSGRNRSVAVVVGVSLLVTVFYLLAYRPVLSSRLPLQTSEFLVQQGKYQSAVPMLNSAAEADPWSAEPYRLMAVATQRLWLKDQKPKQFEEFERVVAEAIRRMPYAHTLRTEMGHRYLEAYRASDDPELLARAIEYQRAAAELNPNDSYVHAQLAWLLSEAGAQEEAAASAQRALELDQINTHDERDLGQRKIFDTEGTLAKADSALEIMQRIAGE